MTFCLTGCWPGNPTCSAYSGTEISERSNVITDFAWVLGDDCTKVGEAEREGLRAAVAKFIPLDAPRISVDDVQPATTLNSYPVASAPACNFTLSLNLIALSQEKYVRSALDDVRSVKQEEFKRLYFKNVGAWMPTQNEHFMWAINYQCNEMDGAHKTAFMDALSAELPTNDKSLKITYLSDAWVDGYPACKISFALEESDHEAEEINAVLTKLRAERPGAQGSWPPGSWMNGVESGGFINAFEKPFTISDHSSAYIESDHEFDTFHQLCFRKALASFLPLASFERIHPTNVDVVGQYDIKSQDEDTPEQLAAQADDEDLDSESDEEDDSGVAVRLHKGVVTTTSLVDVTMDIVLKSQTDEAAVRDLLAKMRDDPDAFMTEYTSLLQGSNLVLDIDERVLILGISSR